MASCPPTPNPHSPVSHASTTRSTRLIAKEIGQLGEFSFQERTELAIDGFVGESSLHAAQPGVARREVDRYVCVPHPQAWVPVTRDVFLRAAEPSDEKQGEAIARGAANAAFFAVVQGGELRLVLVHRIVEALDQGSHRPFPANFIEGDEGDLGRLWGSIHGGGLAPHERCWFNEARPSASTAQFEIVNNTITRNERGLRFSGPAGKYTFLNNVIFGNDVDLPVNAELGPYDFRSNLSGSGQFTGLNGNFSADPAFVDASNLDFRLSEGSPALARGELPEAPLTDIQGNARNELPDIGAYERHETEGERLEGLRCGDSAIQRGPVRTVAGELLGFETCDDGNTAGGDGCSAFCQREPTGALGLISLMGANLCAIRQGGSLSCWNAAATNMPEGSFRQVAVSMYHACALRDDAP